MSGDPFSTRIVIPKVPYRGTVQLDSRTLLIHPTVWQDLRTSLKVEAS